MTAITFTDAKTRAVVRLPDGRTARLLMIPNGRGRSCGTKARVTLSSGAVISIPVDQLTKEPT